jgi:hypothetical protein
MKKILILSLILLTLSFKAFNQINPFTKKEIIWFGVDFSAAKFIGKEGFVNPVDITENKFNSWNMIIIKEPDKYNVRKYFKKNLVNYDTVLVRQRNATVKPDQLVIEKKETYSFGKEKVAEIIKSYTPEEPSGIGLVFIVESFNKPKGKAYIYVTFFDIATKELLFTERVKGEPGGMSMRNYWAGAILSVMNRSQGKLKEWGQSYK